MRRCFPAIGILGSTARFDSHAERSLRVNLASLDLVQRTFVGQAWSQSVRLTTASRWSRKTSGTATGMHTRFVDTCTAFASFPHSDCVFGSLATSGWLAHLGLCGRRDLRDCPDHHPGPRAQLYAAAGAAPDHPCAPLCARLCRRQLPQLPLLPLLHLLVRTIFAHTHLEAQSLTFLQRARRSRLRSVCDCCLSHAHASGVCISSLEESTLMLTRAARLPTVHWRQRRRAEAGLYQQGQEAAPAAILLPALSSLQGLLSRPPQVVCRPVRHYSPRPLRRGHRDRVLRGTVPVEPELPIRLCL